MVLDCDFHLITFGIPLEIHRATSGCNWLGHRALVWGVYLEALLPLPLENTFPALLPDCHDLSNCVPSYISSVETALESADPKLKHKQCKSFLVYTVGVLYCDLDVGKQLKFCKFFFFVRH